MIRRSISVNESCSSASRLSGSEITIYGYLVIVNQSYVPDNNMMIVSFEGFIFNMDVSPKEMALLVDEEKYIPTGLVVVIDADFNKYVAENCSQEFYIGSLYYFRSPVTITGTLEKRLDIDPEVNCVLTNIVSAELHMNSMDDSLRDFKIEFQKGSWRIL